MIESVDPKPEFRVLTETDVLKALRDPNPENAISAEVSRLLTAYGQSVLRFNEKIGHVSLPIPLPKGRWPIEVVALRLVEKVFREGFEATYEPCEKCGGSGKTRLTRRKCNNCSGNGWTKRNIGEGATPDTAIRIEAVSSIDGIPKEYETLTALFGKRDRDWKLMERSLVYPADGRTLEKFVLSVSKTRREVFFDITAWVNNNDERSKAALGAIIDAHDKQLTILIPAGEYIFLTTLLVLVKPQISQLGMTEAELDVLMSHLDAAMENIGEPERTSMHIPVMMLLSRWSQILAVLAFVEPGSLHSEERIETLKTIIDGTIKAARRK